VQRRVADAGWSVVQTPVAAGLAWYIAHTLPVRARVAAAAAAQAAGPHSQLIARLAETCADDTLRLTGKTGSGDRPAGRIRDS
jgi:hypothetical protein